MEFENLKLNKKDEKQINRIMHFFKKGLIIGAGIVALYYLVLIIIEVVKWLNN